MTPEMNDDLPGFEALVRVSMEEYAKLSDAERQAHLRMVEEGSYQLYGDSQDTLASYVTDHMAWSSVTFVGTTAVGITRHIEKECVEVRAKPTDLEEWIDLIILAIDGFWRHGGKPWQLLPMLRAKQLKNKGRKWVRGANPDDPVEHDRTGEVATLSG